MVEELKQFNKYIKAEDIMGLCEEGFCSYKGLNITKEEEE